MNHMTKNQVGRAGVGKSAVARGLGALLIFAALHVQALELGALATLIDGQEGGWSHGFGLRVDQELFRYADVGGRVSYMRSDCHKVYFVPLELTADLKYPLFDDRLVPYAGVGVGYDIYVSGAVSLENSVSVFPLGGFKYYLGEEKRWALFVEARYQFLSANIESGGPPGKTEAQFNGPGGCVGISYRF
jgi:hypothetical protein